jgi:serine/threonine-protein kinase
VSAPRLASAPSDSGESRYAEAPPDPYAAGSHGGPVALATPSPAPRADWRLVYGAAAVTLVGLVVLCIYAFSSNGDAANAAAKSAPPAVGAPARAPAPIVTATASAAPAPARSTSAVIGAVGAPQASSPAPVAPSASAEPAASAAPSAAPSATVSASTDAFDAIGWRAVLRRSATKGDWFNGQAALLALVERAPESFHDAANAAAAREVATVVAHAGGEPADRVFEALTNRLGTDGLDILYDIMAERGGSVGAKRAESILAQKPVLARATPELRIAFELREVNCEGKLALLKRAVAEGDARSLLVLQTFGVACFKRSRALEDAIAELRTKLVRRGQ